MKSEERENYEDAVAGQKDKRMQNLWLTVFYLCNVMHQGYSLTDRVCPATGIILLPFFEFQLLESLLHERPEAHGCNALDARIRRTKHSVLFSARQKNKRYQR